MGLLPPSSSWAGLKSGAHAAAMSRPPLSPPVNETARTRASLTRLPPTCGPPCTSWKTPAGTPASVSARSSTSANTVVPYGAHSLGLRMLVAPAPSEEATLCAAIGPGAFHGTSESAGPHGSRCTSASLPVGPGITRVSRPSRSCAATSRKAPPLITAASMAVVPMGAPVPNDSRAATRMASASIASATDSSTAARSSAGRPDHEPASCSRQAAAATCSMSASDDARCCATTSPVLGFSRSMPSATGASLQAPSTS